jgi:hypothetical protein
VDVVGEAVHQDDRLAIPRAKIDVSDVQRAGVGMLHRPEGGRRPGGRLPASPGPGDLRASRPGHAELEGAGREGCGARGAQETAAAGEAFFGILARVHP